MSERHHRTRPLVEPKVQRRRQRCLGESGRQALVEPADSLLLQDFGHAVYHAGVPVRPPECLTAVAETLKIKNLNLMP